MNDSGLLTLDTPLPPATRRTPRLLHWVTALPVLALLGWSVATAELHGDIRYVLACLRTAGADGLSPSETFTHRPFFYRWFVAGLDSVTAGPVAVREMIIRLAGILLCAAAALVLRWAMARRLPRRDATITAAVVGLSLAFAPRTDFLQPEWAATLLSVVAVALVLGLDRPWTAALAASLPLALAVLMKYSTAATAAMALLVVLAVDRRRALLLAGTTVAGGALLFAISLWSGSHEWQWVRDMPRINKGALTRQGLDPAFLLDRGADFLANRVYFSPMVALLPAALLLLLSRQADRRRRVEWAVLAVLICAGCLAAVAVQGNWFAYHAAALPVFAAAVWGLAVARWYGDLKRPPLFLTAVTALYAVLVPLASLAPAWAQGTAAGWLAGAVALAAACADLRLARDGARRPGTARWPRAALAPVALCGALCVAVTVWPSSPHLMGRAGVSSTNAEYLRTIADKAAAADAVRRRIPDGAPVLYLAFGDDAYFVDHPVRCRYPIPTFLQRVRYLPDVSALRSHAENARCITEDPAPYAVLQRAWFDLDRVDPSVAARIEEVYDCPQTADPRDLVVCRLRAGRG
ncbi:hypothetical protein PV350_26005 [Streptomyces sp. PA03-6a]|nr:hypothetical protein [Streptomyces sp. PA03-6a]